MELWKDIKDWEDYYEISNTGKVRNKITGCVLKNLVNKDGYVYVTLCNKNHKPQHKKVRIHRYVAEHFIPNPNNLPEVNHKNSDLLNNDVSNLEWCTSQDNTRHACKHGNREYKSFRVQFANGVEKIYEYKIDLANELHITKKPVQHWLHKRNNGYLRYGIVSIEYI